MVETPEIRTHNGDRLEISQWMADRASEEIINNFKKYKQINGIRHDIESISFIYFIHYLFLMNPSLLRLRIIINYRLTIENKADDSRV